MFAPGDRDSSRYAGGYRVGLGSPELSALTFALSALADISDEVTQAVQRHDRVALEKSNVRAEELVGQINGLASSLTDEDRASVGQTAIAALCERLAVGARRNAYLIEQAWATDAALMRLVVGVGKGGRDGTGYGDPPAQPFVDRQA